MKAIDKYLQNVRIRKAKKYIRINDDLLDIGTADGAMFKKLHGIINYGVGIDPGLASKVITDRYTLLPGYFPDISIAGRKYDAITLLAVLEHIPPVDQDTLAAHCFNLLNKNGRIIITVPSPKVDFILSILRHIKLIDGMSLEEHYGFKPVHTLKIFSNKYFKLIANKRFQLGLNNLFVFEKID